MYPWYVSSAGRYLSEKHGVAFPALRGWQLGGGGFSLKEFLDANRNFSVFVAPRLESGAKDKSWEDVYSMERSPTSMANQLVQCFFFISVCVGISFLSVSGSQVGSP